MSENADFSPCKLNEYKGTFSILYSDFDQEFYRRAQRHQGQGGGHSLQAMAVAALDIEAIRLADISLDSEADMFVARGDKSSLKIVAAIVRKLLADGAYAERAIAHALARGEFD